MGTISAVCLLLFQINVVHSQVVQQDINAIKDLYYSTDGPNWRHTWNINKLNNGDVCSLYGVRCVPNVTPQRVGIIQMPENELDGTLPVSIGNLSDLIQIDLRGNSLHGNIPSTIGNLSQLTYIQLSYNSFSAAIPDVFGNLSQLELIDLKYNNLSGTIPQSISQLYYMEDIDLRNNSIEGTIPEGFGMLSRIIAFQLDSNNLSGTIPDIFENMTNLTNVILNNNNFVGSIPASMGNKTKLKTLTVAYNQLTGDIPDSFLMLPSITTIFLSDNDISSDHFGDFMVKWMANWNATSNAVRQIMVQNNPKLSGDLSVLEQLTSDVYIDELVIYNCSLFGSIPNSLRLQKVETLWIWNNRLSCELPANFINSQSEPSNLGRTSFMILPSNLFKIKSNSSMPSYLLSNHSYYTDSLMYYTNTDEIISWIVAICAMISILVFLFVEIINFCQKEKPGKLIQTSPYHDALFGFFDNLVFIKKSMNDVRMMLMAVVLCIFYGINSNYFKCSPILSQIGIGYYEASNSYYDWILVVVLLPISYIFLLNIIAKAQIKQSVQNEEFQQADNFNEMVNVVSTISHKSDVSEYEACNVISTLFSFFFYFLLFLASICVVILSLIFDSLPENNSFNMTVLSMKLTAYLMAIVLTINSAIIIPNLVDQSFLTIRLCIHSLSDINYLVNYRSIIIIILRSFSNIICPFITAVVMLNDCGRFWTKLWIDCNESNRWQFDWQDADGTGNFMLTSEQVCSSRTFLNIPWNECLRSFVTTWSFVITQKMIYMIIMPLLMILFKQLQHKVYSKVSIFNKYMYTNIVWDIEYVMVLSKLESMIIFGAVSPFIIPLTISSINSNYFVYRKMVEKHNWRVKPFDHNTIFPIFFLWISVIISQVFISLFVFLSIKNKMAGYVLISLLIIIDVGYIRYYRFMHKRAAQSKAKCLQVTK